MKFRYKRYGQTLRPVIEVRLKNGEQSVRYEVLVDSGADLCLFDSEIGEAIGLEIIKGTPREVFGVGGKSSMYYLHQVTLEVGGWPFVIEARFMPKVGNRMIPYGLVGQKGFFENFIVKFNLLKEEVELKSQQQ